MVAWYWCVLIAVVGFYAGVLMCQRWWNDVIAEYGRRPDLGMEVRGRNYVIVPKEIFQVMIANLPMGVQLPEIKE